MKNKVQMICKQMYEPEWKEKKMRFKWLQKKCINRVVSRNEPDGPIMQKGKSWCKLTRKNEEGDQKSVTLVM